MKYTHIIWDFNGTLFDDVAIGIDCINALLSRRGKPLVTSLEDYHSVFTFPIIDYYKNVGLCTCEEDYTAPANEWIAEYLAREKNASLYPHTAEVLGAVREKGYTQLVLSATERTMLERQLTGLGLRPFFDEVLGRGDIYAHSKTEIGIAWAKAHPEAKALYFGDCVHDAEVAAAMGADCVLIAAGHQSKTTLQTCGVPVIGSITDVPGLL